MSAKISQKHDNMYYIRKNYKLKSIYDNENECINYTLSVTYGRKILSKSSYTRHISWYVV